MITCQVRTHETYTRGSGVVLRIIRPQATVGTVGKALPPPRASFPVPPSLAPHCLHHAEEKTLSRFGSPSGRTAYAGQQNMTIKTCVPGSEASTQSTRCGWARMRAYWRRGSNRTAIHGTQMLRSSRQRTTTAHPFRFISTRAGRRRGSGCVARMACDRTLATSHENHT